MSHWPTETLDDDGVLAEAFGEGETAENEPVDEGEQEEDLSLVDPSILALIAEVETPNELTAYDDTRPPSLPQPDRAKSVPNLPKVKSSAFIRILR